MTNILKTSGAVALLLFGISCEQDDQQSLVRVDDSPIFRDIPAFNQARSSSGRTGRNLAVLSAEYITSVESGQVGRTVYFKDVGNKKLTEDFVPGYSVDGTNNVSYYIDESRPSDDVSVAVSSAAITRAMTTWDDVTCSDLGMFQVPFDPSIETGFVAAVLEIPGIEGGFDAPADVIHAGWLPAVFFDAIAPDGSEYILGVTFTIIYTDEDNNPTDIDNNGKLDVAFREIYYNDAFEWADGDDGVTYDIETIALHEAGHGLSQDHFGSAFRNSGNTKLHFSPRAVMNAAYSGEQTTIRATDNAGHCSNWSSWPNN